MFCEKRRCCPIVRNSILYNKSYIKIIFSTFCIVDKVGTCVAVTVFNLAEGKGVIIGDSVAIPEPFVTDVDFTYKENVSDLRFILITFYFWNTYLNDLIIQANNK